MIGVSASINLPLHHKVQKFSAGTGSPGWSQKKGRKTVVVWCGVVWCMHVWLFVFLFVCMVTDFSAADKDNGMKLCIVV